MSPFFIYVFLNTNSIENKQNFKKKTYLLLFCSSVHGGGGIRGHDVVLIPIKYHDRKWEGKAREGEGTEFAEVPVIGALITENNQLYNTSQELLAT